MDPDLDSLAGGRAGIGAAWAGCKRGRNPKSAFRVTPPLCPLCGARRLDLELSATPGRRWFSPTAMASLFCARGPPEWSRQQAPGGEDDVVELLEGLGGLDAIIDVASGDSTSCIGSEVCQGPPALDQGADIAAQIESMVMQQRELIRLESQPRAGPSAKLAKANGKLSKHMVSLGWVGPTVAWGGLARARDHPPAPGEGRVGGRKGASCTA